MGLKALALGHDQGSLWRIFESCLAAAAAAVALLLSALKKITPRVQKKLWSHTKMRNQKKLVYPWLLTLI